MRKQVHVSYSGRVQGVGFRLSVREIACGFELAGFVRNLPDGRVELVAAGAEAELLEFLQAIRDSQLGGYIRHEAMDWQSPANAVVGFEIRY